MQLESWCSAARSNREGAAAPKRSSMPLASDASAAPGFPAQRRTNSERRSAKGLPPTPAARAGRIRRPTPSVPQRQHSQKAHHSRLSLETSKPRPDPRYRVLLDDVLPRGCRQVPGTSDVGDLLASATNRPPTTDVAVAARYDGL